MTGDLEIKTRSPETDMCDRPEKKEALRNSSQMFQNVLDHFPGVVFWKDRNSVYLGCNRKFSTGAGLADPKEIIGKTDYDLPWAKTEADSYRADDRLVMESGKSKLNIVETQLQADGSIIWFDTNKIPLFDNEGKVIGVLGTSNDITERKRAEEELIKSAEEIHDLFNRAPCGYHSLDKDGVFIRINDTELQWLGYLREEVIGKVKFSDLLTSKSVKTFEENFPVFKKRGWIRDLEFEMMRKNGTILPVLVSATAITEPDGSYTMSRSTVYDITERKKAEQALREIQEELARKEKLAILGQLAGTLGHEIRNPLGVMSNAVFFLNEILSNADDMVKEYLDIIKQEIDNSQRIITDLLDFSRTKTPHTSPLAVSPLVEQSLNKCRVPENIKIEIDIPDGLPFIKADMFQIIQVLQNIITNAVQAMHGGGALKIAARPVHPPSLKASARQAGAPAFAEGFGAASGRKAQGSDDEGVQFSPSGIDPDKDLVEISVADTGGGISPENMKKLFQPLFTTKAKGIGLGLVVCKNLVEANGGRISVQSHSGKGTTFTILLPISGGDE